MINPEYIADLRGPESSRSLAKKWKQGKTTINEKRAELRKIAPPADGPKVLYLDIEMTPIVAYTWSLWPKAIGINQMIEDPYMLCFGAKWAGSDTVVFKSVHHDGKEQMLRELHMLLDQAEVVSGWNSASFDSKHIKREFLENGFTPPSPWKELDLMREAKKQFRMPSNKLDYYAQKLGLGAKVQHGGFQLWIDCMAGDDKAWDLMREYQVQDVDLLPLLHEKLRPWIKNPTWGVHSDKDGCARCGSTDAQKRGKYATDAGVYQRFQCNNCGGWFRGTKRLSTSEFRSV